MFSFFFIRKHKDMVLLYIDRVYNGAHRDIRYALSIDEDEKPKEKKGVVEPKFSRELDLSSLDSIKYSDRRSTKDSFDAKQVAETMRSHLMEDKPSVSLMSNANISFVMKLEQYIRDKDLVVAEVYKKANIDRRLFSKMLCNRDYQPSKDTVLALIFALKLNLNEAKDLLERAGYTLSHSIRRDIILEYFIKEGVYNLNNINAFLYNMNEKIVGRNL